MPQSSSVLRVVTTPEQSKDIKLVDIAILSMIPDGDTDKTTYLNELLKTNRPKQQNKTFLFPTPEKPRKTEYHTPIQTRIVRGILELTEEEKLKPQDDTETQAITLE